MTIDLDELERLIAHGGAGVVVIDRGDLSTMIAELRELRAENARLRELLGEVLTHPNIAPCECQSSNCLTTRIRAALGEPQ